jgi:N-acetylglutamate synthase-like GNAT family acetyltransferase
MGRSTDTTIVFYPTQIKLADGTNTTFDGSTPDIRFEEGGKVSELKNYIKDIEVVNDDEEGIMYSGSYGNSGGLNWVKRGNVIEVVMIESGNQKGSSGTMAIASLFLLNPKVQTITYQDHSHFEDGTSFWIRIGGDYTDLERSDFFNYFQNKFGYNPDIRFEQGGEVKIKNDILHDRIETEYRLDKSYAEVIKQNTHWSIDYIEAKKKGDGTKLMNTIIEDAKNQKIHNILLQTGSAKDFFEKFGFVTTQKDNGYYYMEYTFPDIRFEKGGEIETFEKNDSVVLKYYVDNEEAGYLIYIIDKNGVMSVGLNKEPYNYQNEMYIEMVEVFDKYKNRGIAKIMIKRAIEIANKHNIDVITLKRDSGLGCLHNTEYDKYLKKIYSSLGFIETWTDIDSIESGGEKNICAMHLPLIIYSAGGAINAVSRPISNLDISRVKKGVVQLHSVHPKRITNINDLPI